MWVLVTIRRTSRSPEGTIGTASLAGHTKERFESLEPQDCIPAGVYEAYLHRVPVLGVDHPQFRRVYELQHVPGHKHVEIDRGHFAGDVKVGLVNDMLGMIAFGFGFGLRSPGNGFAKQICLQHSARAIAKFMCYTQGTGIRVEILDP
jgi:hypothetical protein